MVSAYAKTDELNAVAMATTAANGSYTLTVPVATGASLDGFLKATSKTNGQDNADTYLYPPAPLSADFTGAAVNVVTPLILSLLPLQVQLDSGTSVTALEVVESTTTLTGVAGATVQATQATGVTVVYAGASGTPDTAQTSTAASGLVFVFGLAPGQVTLTATKTGATFKPTTLKIHANALNTTIVTQ